MHGKSEVHRGHIWGAAPPLSTWRSATGPGSDCTLTTKGRRRGGGSRQGKSEVHHRRTGGEGRWEMQ